MSEQASRRYAASSRETQDVKPLRSWYPALIDQAQTAECLVVGEVATDRLLVVLNKVDLLPVQTRDKAISKAQRMLLKTFAHTKFRKPPVVSISAKPGSALIHSHPAKVTQFFALPTQALQLGHAESTKLLQAGSCGGGQRHLKINHLKSMYRPTRLWLQMLASSEGLPYEQPGYRRWCCMSVFPHQSWKWITCPLN